MIHCGLRWSCEAAHCGSRRIRSASHAGSVASDSFSHSPDEPAQHVARKLRVARALVQPHAGPEREGPAFLLRVREDPLEQLELLLERRPRVGEPSEVVEQDEVEPDDFTGAPGHRLAGIHGRFPDRGGVRGKSDAGPSAVMQRCHRCLLVTAGDSAQPSTPEAHTSPPRGYWKPALAGALVAGSRRTAARAGGETGMPAARRRKSASLAPDRRRRKRSWYRLDLPRMKREGIAPAGLARRVTAGPAAA